MLINIMFADFILRIVLSILKKHNKLIIGIKFETFKSFLTT